MTAVSWHVDPICTRLAGRFGEPISLGEPEVNWDDRVVVRGILPGGIRVVIKVDLNASRHARELCGLSAARASGAPTANVVFVDSNTPGLIVLSEVATSDSLATTDSISHWRAAGRGLRLLHDGTIPDQMLMFQGGRGDWKTHILEWSKFECTWAERHGKLTPAEYQLCTEHLTSRFSSLGRPSPVIIHGDIQARHVLINGHDVVFVDFGDTGWGDSTWDLVVLTHWHPARRQAVLEGYEAEASERRRLEQFGSAYSLLRHLMVARWYSENEF